MACGAAGNSQADDWQQVDIPAAVVAGAAPADFLNDELRALFVAKGLTEENLATIPAKDAPCTIADLVTGAASEDDARSWAEELGLGSRVLKARFVQAWQDARSAPAPAQAPPSMVDPASAPPVVAEPPSPRPAGPSALPQAASAPSGFGLCPSPASEPQVQLEECIAVCIDRSGSMGSPFSSDRTRMEAVKQMFYAFRDRIESLGSGTHQLGLLQFDDKVDRLLNLTPQLNLFEEYVDEMEKKGRTAIFSSIYEGCSMLAPIFAESPQIDLRILVLTDGQNNEGISPQQALEEVNRIGAIVDAIIVGNSPDSNLRKIVSATGGECYQIKDLGEGFELLESESVVSLRARRGGGAKPVFAQRPHVDFGTIQEKSLTSAKAVQRAPVLDPSLAKSKVVSMAEIAKRSKSAPKEDNGGGIRGAGLVRIRKELAQVAEASASIWTTSGEGVHIFPSPDRLDFWRALIEGPPGSPFEGGVFVLNVVLPTDYPFKPPSITFQTPVYHCNVNDSGNLCLDMLRDQWNPALSVPKCLEAIRNMLAHPNTDDALRQWIAELTIAHNNSGGKEPGYVDKVREEIQKHATKSVAEWRMEWGCDQ